MRIIAGEHRGRKLLAPLGDTTRPVTDRVKQSIFDIIGPLVAGAIVYDCFAGTGSMGLECLSRGAEHVTFFESDRSAIKRLRDNIASMRVGDRSAVSTGDLFKTLKAAPARSPANFSGTAGVESPRLANLVFLDPPYRFLNEKPELLRVLAEDLAADHLTPEGVVIFRHDAADAIELPALTACDVRRYGNMAVELLQRRS